MYLFLFLNKIMFSKSLLDGLFNIQPYDLKRKTNQSFNLMDHISKDISGKDLNKLFKSEAQVKSEIPVKDMFKPKDDSELSILKEELNKYSDFIYKNEVLIEQLKEEIKSAKEYRDKLEKKIKELEQDINVIIKDFADCFVKKGGLKIYADELLRLYDIIKNTKDVHIDIVRLEKGYDLIIELGKEIDTTNIKLFKGIFKFMNEFMM